MISDRHTAVLTSDVEILQLLLVVRDGQMEHQQLLGVALSRAVHQRAGEVVVVPADVDVVVFLETCIAAPVLPDIPTSSI